MIRMGFFLHIPFPSFDIIRIFPWVDEILMGMLGTIYYILKFIIIIYFVFLTDSSVFYQQLIVINLKLSGCNLVGFHTEDYCLNFIDCCQRVLGCRVDKTKMIVYNTMCRKTSLLGSMCSQMDGVYIKALPIGIPYERFENLSRTASRVFPDCCKIILGVDRLDYTKGIL